MAVVNNAFNDGSVRRWSPVIFRQRCHPTYSGHWTPIYTYSLWCRSDVMQKRHSEKVLHIIIYTERRNRKACDISHIQSSLATIIVLQCPSGRWRYPPDEKWQTEARLQWNISMLNCKSKIDYCDGANTLSCQAKCMWRKLCCLPVQNRRAFVRPAVSLTSSQIEPSLSSWWNLRSIPFGCPGLWLLSW